MTGINVRPKFKTGDIVVYLGYKYNVVRVNMTIRGFEYCLQANANSPVFVVYDESALSTPLTPSTYQGISSGAALRAILEETNNHWDAEMFIAQKCECGAEKTYGVNTNLHSDWCAKGRT